MSPGLRSRPSLSELGYDPLEHRAGGVAGITVPAFVERFTVFEASPAVSGVAGITVPAFVERPT